jgi:ParB/RepB/Spo0J family partition protein
MDKNLRLVPARSVHLSSVLPTRQHGEELSNSVKQIGIQVPIIVRCVAGKTDEFEIVDGAGRCEALKDDEQILVDIRADLKDSDVFKISDATFSRKERAPYEIAQFYKAWLKTIEKEEGTAEASQQKLATRANLSESSLSQHLAIARLFQKLQETAPEEQFSKLKTWSINKLYKLSELTDDSRLLDLARLYEQKFETPIEEVTSDVDSYRGTKQTQESSFDQQNAKPETDRSSLPSEQQLTTSSDESRKIFLKSAKKVESLAAENHEILYAIVQEFIENPDRRYPTDALQILAKMLRTLRKVRKHSSVLWKKIKPQITEGSQ